MVPKREDLDNEHDESSNEMGDEGKKVDLFDCKDNVHFLQFQNFIKLIYRYI